ncbi:MAG: cob(I)yrinic acid a,c-diamide adenosyltransferase [Myxococcales bacterium]|nr:cob(I)yrinic acid a,c-diamide adenosyltransferase [Myxococcales bacterium]MCB9642071.1 cob(I)yrinic acid a,c-diamide adenosyltransferase [Myxococcales bacterium]
MKIYTRAGDGGETGLLGNVRVSKGSDRVEAYGSVDELVSWLGLVRTESNDPELSTQVGEIQATLFFVNSELATPSDREPFGEIIGEDAVSQLEDWIDACDEETPALKSFILPGGSKTSAQLHVARTICRRAERSVVRLMAEEPLRKVIVHYLNRLSDLLFALGRRANYREGVEEVLVNNLRKPRTPKTPA